VSSLHWQRPGSEHCMGEWQPSDTLGQLRWKQSWHSWCPSGRQSHSHHQRHRLCSAENTKPGRRKVDGGIAAHLWGWIGTASIQSKILLFELYERETCGQRQQPGWQAQYELNINSVPPAKQGPKLAEEVFATTDSLCARAQDTDHRDSIFMLILSEFANSVSFLSSSHNSTAPRSEVARRGQKPSLGEAHGSLKKQEPALQQPLGLEANTRSTASRSLQWPWPAH
jgi:hypothetical protein